MNAQPNKLEELSDSARFLQRLDPDAQYWVYQLFRSDQPGKGITHRGSFEHYEPELHRLNQQGWDIFVTVNDATGRNKKDVQFCRALWVEADVPNPRLPSVAPHLVVETSPGHHHYYWLHERLPYPSADWDAAQKHMVAAFDCDPMAVDASRVLRIPGFFNHKRQAQCNLIALTDTPLYPWDKLVTALGVPKTPPKEDVAAEPTGGLPEYLRQIAAGEHLHGPIRAIMLINANNGLDEVANRMVCTGLIHSWPGEAERKLKALADLPAMLRATYGKIEAENVAEPIHLKERRYAEDVPIPPGYLGQLALSANEFFVVPNMTAAVMTSLSLVAGIVGRRYNVSSSGLNLYTTIMMPTGAGKDSIRKFCQRVLMDMTMLGANGLSFLGSQNFTGPKALLNELSIKPSMLCVMTEAGLLYKSDSGDRMGLTRVILQAYTSSGQKEFIEAEQYSKAEDSIQQVKAPALTILNEATPVTLLSELHKRESLNTGELPRMWIFMLDGKKPYNNPSPHQLNLPPEILQRVKALVTDCYTVQNSLPPTVIEIELHPETVAFTNWCTDRHNELNEIDQNRAILYSRAAHKVMKVAAICSVFNGNVGFIDDDSWEWAKKLFEYEMKQVDRIIGASDQTSDASSKIADMIVRILLGQYGVATNKNRFISEDLRKKGIFTESAFRQVAQMQSTITAMGASKKYGDPKSGGRVALDFALHEGWIVPVELPKNIGRPSKYYKVTGLFRDLYGSSI